MNCVRSIFDTPRVGSSGLYGSACLKFGEGRGLAGTLNLLGGPPVDATLLQFGLHGFGDLPTLGRVGLARARGPRELDEVIGERGAIGLAGPAFSTGDER